MVPLEPFKNKVFKPRRQGPGKRSLPGRPTKAFQGTCRDAPRVPARPGERQASGRDKTTAAARRLPRQVITLHPRSSASTNVLPWGLPRRALQEAVQPAVRGGKRADKIAIVASGGVPDGPFLHYLGDVDGHLMPLSPAVRVRYDTLYR